MSSLPLAFTPPSGAATNVLVLHRSALVAAGLASTLQRLPDFNVRVGDDGAWRDDLCFEGIDVLVTDPGLLARRHGSFAAPGPGAGRTPRVVLLATTARDELASRHLPTTVSACLSLRSEEDEILAAVRGDDPKPARPQASREASPADGVAVPARPTGGLSPYALRQVREHVQAHLREKIPMADLAGIAGVSACHFSRAFKQSVGVSPHRYVMRRRIEEAARLVNDTDAPLADIGLDVGFSDHSHFTRVFVSVMGETPRAFRHRHR